MKTSSTTVYKDFWDKRRRVDSRKEALDILHLLIEASDRLANLKNAATGDIFATTETYSQVYRNISDAYSGVYALGKDFGYELDTKVWKYPSRKVELKPLESVA
jgi:hypothetical protein